MKKKNLIGQIFGDLTVIKEGSVKIIGKNKKHRGTWLCKCICDKEIEILTSNLLRKKNHPTSCGCKFRLSKKYNFKDLTGLKFGKLTVIDRSSEFSKTRGALWNCQCECGNLIKLASNCLTSGNNITCGNKSIHSNSSIRCGEISYSHINSIKQNAIKRNLKYEVTPEYLWNLFLQQNKKCPLTGDVLVFTSENNASATRNLTTASLDRIDSNLGYIQDNVRWVHKTINKMRSNMTDEQFLSWCTKCCLNQYQNRPSWDEYFLMLAFDISYRSEDPDIHHGAIITDDNNHILGTGYNATIKNSDKDLIPLNIRDEKRKWMIHAEENAILNCSLNPLNYHGKCKIYITGLPCVNCLQRIINFGISEIIYANRIGSIISDSDEMRDKLIEMSNIKVSKVDTSNIWIQKNMHN